MAEVGDLAPSAEEIPVKDMETGAVAEESKEIKEDAQKEKDNVGGGPNDVKKDLTKKEKPKKKQKENPFKKKKKATQPNPEFNLNNCVVNMRKEVKRIRVWVIRKLVRKIADLKKKTGTEEELKKNEGKVARIIEEIHALKALKTDVVTKTALQKDLNFVALCGNPKTKMSDRALARIATHPKFKEQIDAIRAGVQAFKEKRMREYNEEKQKRWPKKDKIPVKLPYNKCPEEAQIKRQEKKDELVEEQKDGLVEEQRDELVEEQRDELVEEQRDELVEEQRDELVEEQRDELVESTVKKDKTGTSTVLPKTNDIEEKLPTPSSDITDDHKSPDNPIAKPKSFPSIKSSREVKRQPQTKTLETKSHDFIMKPKPSPNSTSSSKEVKSTPQVTTFGTKSDPKLSVDAPQTKAATEEESDLSDDDEEKEYFDDSTEERFRKQSSHSECSDSDDDFFIGKVSKLGKKKNAKEGGDTKQEAEEDSGKKSDGLQGQLDELESRLKSKPTKFQSVFCSSLSQSRPGRGREGKEVWGQNQRTGFQKDEGSFKSTFGERRRGQDGFSQRGRGGFGSHQPYQSSSGSFKSNYGEKRRGHDGFPQRGRGGFGSHDPSQSSSTSFKSTFGERRRGQDGFSQRGRGGFGSYESSPSSSASFKSTFGERRRGQEGFPQRDPGGFGSHEPSQSSSASFKSTVGERRGQEGFSQRGRGGFGGSHQPSQTPLHPSWEASKRKKEQQGNIQAFQGKKIKFDDSD